MCASTLFESSLVIKVIISSISLLEFRKCSLWCAFLVLCCAGFFSHCLCRCVLVSCGWRFLSSSFLFFFFSFFPFYQIDRSSCWHCGWLYSWSMFRLSECCWCPRFEIDGAAFISLSFFLQILLLLVSFLIWHFPLLFGFALLALTKWTTLWHTFCTTLYYDGHGHDRLWKEENYSHHAEVDYVPCLYGQHNDLLYIVDLWYINFTTCTSLFLCWGCWTTKAVTSYCYFLLKYCFYSRPIFVSVKGRGL